jgi:hypothetical protein
MPIMNGDICAQKILEFLKSKNETVNILALTSYTTE